MKLKFAVAILFASFVVLSVSAQSKKDLKKNKVKSVRETETTLVNGKELTADNSFYRYDSNNEVIEEIDYDSEGKVKMHNTYVYNKNGDKIEEVVYHSDGKIKKKKVFKYNSTGDKTDETQYDAAGNLIQKSTYAYNANGDRITEVTVDAKGK